MYYIEGGSALSGSIQTKYFGEGFNASKIFLPSFAVNIWISIPDRHRLKLKTNLGIYVEVEKNSLSRRFNDKLDAVGPVIDKKWLNFTRIGQHQKLIEITYRRQALSNRDIEDMSLDKMPGFRVRWFYTLNETEAKPNRGAPNSHPITTKAFRKLTNILVLTNTSIEAMWSAVHRIRFNMAFDKTCTESLYNDADASVAKLEQELNITSSDEVLENVTIENLKIAGEMFIYQNFCVISSLHWLIFYKDLVLNQTPDTIILTLNRVLKAVKSKSDYIIARNLLTKIETIFAVEEISKVESLNATGIQYQ